MGAGWRGAALKPIWLSCICFILPLKIFNGQKFSLSGPPRWYHKKTSIPDVEITVGKRSIVSEWAPEDNGRWERAWWTAPMVSVLWKYRVVSDVHIFQSAMLLFPEQINSDALLYLKLWYSFYIRVKYQRLHENNLARRAQLMCVTLTPAWYDVCDSTCYHSNVFACFYSRPVDFHRCFYSRRLISIVPINVKNCT